MLILRIIKEYIILPLIATTVVFPWHLLQYLVINAESLLLNRKVIKWSQMFQTESSISFNGQYRYFYVYPDKNPIVTLIRLSRNMFRPVAEFNEFEKNKFYYRYRGKTTNIKLICRSVEEIIEKTKFKYQ